MACRLCTHYNIDDLLPYALLELCSYWGCGQVFHNNNYYVSLYDSSNVKHNSSNVKHNNNN